MKKYTQLTEKERIKLYEMKKTRVGIREIARSLDRSPSTISRELKRNSDSVGYLDPRDAHEATKRRKAKHKSKVERLPKFKEYLLDRLKDYWSPGAIAGRWSKSRKKRKKITAETIYAFIYSKPGRALGLIELLPRRKKKRGMRKKSNAGTIQHRVSIHERPAHIEQRLESGHFEGDLMFNKGSMSENTLTMVERKSRLTILIKHHSKQSDPIIESIAKFIGSVAKTITLDNGTEFAAHYKLQALGIQTYFCDPAAPHQKGAIENINGMARRFIPSYMPASDVTQKLLDSIATTLNNTPRKSLKYLTPLEQFMKDQESRVKPALPAVEASSTLDTTKTFYPNNLTVALHS